MDKIQLLNGLERRVEKCQCCLLHKTRTKIVFGIGSVDAKLMIVSEAPGYWEDQKGEPFVGAAGKVLNELLESVKIKRENIYIANILKCRPPQNRDPQKEEIKACSPYLERQIEIIGPKVICSLGNFSTRYIMEKYGLGEKIEGISKIHGKVFELKTLFGSVKIIPFYHPAVATYNINMKKILLEDFKILEKFR